MLNIISEDISQDLGWHTLGIRVQESELLFSRARRWFRHEATACG